MERDVLKRSMVGWVKDARKLTWQASSPTRGRVTDCRTPQPCLLLGMSLKWFHKWPDQASDPAAANSLFTTMDRRRNTIEPAVKVILGKKHGLHGSPRLHAAPSMTTGPRQTRRSRIRCAVECWWRGGSSAGTGSPGRTRPVPKLIDSPHRDLTTDRPDTHRASDMTEVPPTGGKPYAATVNGLILPRSPQDGDRPASQHQVAVLGEQNTRQGPRQC